MNLRNVEKQLHHFLPQNVFCNGLKLHITRALVDRASLSSAVTPRPLRPASSTAATKPVPERPRQRNAPRVQSDGLHRRSYRTYYVSTGRATGGVTIDERGDMVASLTAPYFRKILPGVGTAHELARRFPNRIEIGTDS